MQYAIILTVLAVSLTSAAPNKRSLPERPDETPRPSPPPGCHWSRDWLMCGNPEGTPTPSVTPTPKPSPPPGCHWSRDWLMCGNPPEGTPTPSASYTSTPKDTHSPQPPQGTAGFPPGPYQPAPSAASHCVPSTITTTATATVTQTVTASSNGTCQPTEFPFIILARTNSGNQYLYASDPSGNESGSDYFLYSKADFNDARFTTRFRLDRKLNRVTFELEPRSGGGPQTFKSNALNPGNLLQFTASSTADGGLKLAQTRAGNTLVTSDSDGINNTGPWSLCPADQGRKVLFFTPSGVQAPKPDCEYATLTIEEVVR